MQSFTLLELLQDNNICLFCQSPLIIKMSWHDSNLSQLFSILEDGYFSYKGINTIFNIDLQTNRYWLKADQLNILTEKDEDRFSDNWHFIKECFNCDHRFSIITSDIIFKSGYIEKFFIYKMKFHIHSNPNENFVVTQDYQFEKTKIIFSKLKDKYSGILLPDDKCIEMPLIKFNSYDTNKIINKIKILTLLS